MKHLRFFPILLAALLITCATTGPGGKKSLIIIPTSQEVSIGQGIVQELQQTETSLPDTVWQNYVNDIGQRLVKVCDRQDLEYHFTVIESDQINAFAVPGGFVYFYTGLLREMENESELAAVMAHEISHIVGRHSIKRIQAALGISTAYQLVFGGDEASKIMNTAINLGMMLLFAEYSRENEREADEFGIHYMRQAGYNPEGAVTMFHKLASLGGGGDSNVFEKLASSHPATQERINNAENQIARMGTLPGDLRTGRDKYQQMRNRLPQKTP